MAPEKGITVPPSVPAPRVTTLGQLWQVPLFLLGLLAVLAVWEIRPLWYDPKTVRLRYDLDAARSQLQDPHAALNELTVLLNEDLSHIGRLPNRAGETHFLLGSTYLRLAEQLPAERAADFWRKARSHLEQAEQLGVPENDRPPLLYRLGKASYHTGGDLQRVIDYLSKTIEQVDDDRAAGYEMLTQCYLRLPAPNLAAALQANEAQLQLPTVPESRLVPARLLRGELLLRLQQRDAARKVLARIGSDAPPALLARARTLRARAFQEEEAWAEAAKLWEEILADRRQPSTDSGRIAYLLGCCYRNLQRPKDAVRAWEAAVQQGGEEGQAAGLRSANVLVQSSNISEALLRYDQALAKVRQPADYRNNLLTLPEAGNLLAADCRACKDAGNFEAAGKLARLYAKLVSPAVAHVLTAQVAEAWAIAQHARAEPLKDAASAQREEEASRSHFREAAEAYAAAALATAGLPEESEWLWRGGGCAMRGQAFRAALTAYEHLFKLRPPLARLSEACYRLGEAHQALREDGPAEKSYQYCIQTNGPFKYLARYQLALVEIGRAKFGAAEEMLEQNLLLMRAEPELDREAHEKTLYALGEVLFSSREFAMAAQYLETLLVQYPTSPNALTARYHAGQCNRGLADRQSKPGNPLDTQLRNRGGQFIMRLEQAAAHFQKLVDDLQARPAAASLPEGEATLLRQARRALADCRFDQGHYGEAVPLYIGLANRQPPQVDNVVALRQLYTCYVVLMAQDKPEASSDLVWHALEDMRKVLSQLDESAFQGRPETERRTYLEGWLKAEEKHLQDLGFNKPPR